MIGTQKFTVNHVISIFFVSFNWSWNKQKASLDMQMMFLYTHKKRQYKHAVGFVHNSV